jgi:UDP-4-amino-4,6-dideoxy-N-acetyl-beta-L-altrosamine transaminase
VNPIPYGRQSVSQEDIDAVVEVLRSDWLTQGPVIPRFEQAIADYCGVRYGTAVSNATAGLHVAYRALDLGPGDLLWTSPNTFVATANAALYCGADVDFVDIDERTFNMSVPLLEAKLAAAKKSGRLPKIVAPVHFGGEPCDMEAIGELARRYGFRVVEDAAHAIGAEYQGEKIGSCRHSDAVVFSFFPVKIITTGEGGMVMTRSEEVHERLQRLRSHGITRKPGEMSGDPDGPWSYEQIDLGYNYRITDIQAALGLTQLKRLDQFVAARHKIADRYEKALAGFPLKLPVRGPNRRSALHLYVIRTERRKEVYEHLHAAGILVQVHYIPVHLQPYYARLGFKRGQFPVAERYYEAAVTLPIFPALTPADQDRVVAELRRVLM